MYYCDIGKLGFRMPAYVVEDVSFKCIAWKSAVPFDRNRNVRARCCHQVARRAREVVWVKTCLFAQLACRCRIDIDYSTAYVALIDEPAGRLGWSLIEVAGRLAAQQYMPFGRADHR